MTGSQISNRSLVLLSTALVLVSSLVTGDAFAQKRGLFNIGTAGVTGIFWPTGGYTCNLVNKSRKSQGHSLRCTVESTAGSVSNLRALRRGDLDLGLAQSDLQYRAYNGVGPFKDEGPNKDLRFVMSFTTNMIHVVVRTDAGIDSIADIKGKRFNTGNPGSGTEATSRLVLSYWGIDVKNDLGLESKLTSREQSKALCDGKIDGYLYPTAVPVATIEEAANTCDVKLLSVQGENLDRLIAENPYYGKTVIPAGSYRGQDQDVHTFGYAASLVTTTALPEETGYHLAKAVMNGFDGYAAQAPAFRLMKRETSVTFGKHVPYHAGVERYYREAGLIK
jgi:TRAP transporter TAXI family solute receptor